MVFSGIISEDFDSNVSWTLTVGGQTFTGTGTSVSATWYGQDAFGRIVSPGNYTAMVSATDDGGCTAVSSVTIQVIAPPPSDNTSSTNSSDNTNDTPSLEVCAGSTNNVANGTLSHQQSLFSTKGISLATDMQLNYSSSDSYDGPLGLGWSHSYDMRLSFNSDGSAVLREGNGVKRYYTISGSGYVSQTGDTSSLRNVGGTYQVTFRDGRKYTFNQDGRIAAITDRYNNSIVFAYSNGDLITITDPAGRTTTLGYDPAKPHRINSVADPNNNVYNFTYQGDSLWQVINPAADPAASPERGYWEYIYYTDGYRKGYLQSKRDPNGNITQYDYDSNHRLLSAIDPEGAATSAGHTRSFQYQMDSGYTTKLTDKDGGAWSYTYDPNTGVLTAKVDPNNKKTTYTYDSNRYLKSVTRPGDGKPEETGLLLTTFYRHDNYGNLTDETEPINLAGYGITDPASVDVTKIGTSSSPLKWAFHYAYDYAYYDQPTSVTDLRDSPPLPVTFDRYQENGLLVTRITEPGVATTSPRVSYQRLNPDGTLQSAADANGKTATYTYYPKTQANKDTGKAEMLLTVTDKNGVTTSYTDYDKNGNLKAVKLVGTDNVEVPVSTTNLYDNLNRLSAITKTSTAAQKAFPDNVTKLWYDNAGNITSRIDAETKETLYEYNYLHQLTKVTDALPNMTNYNHSGSGCTSCGTGVDQLVEIKNNDVVLITYVYDKLGRLERQIDPLGKVIRYTYYDSGLLKQKIDATVSTAEKVLISYYYNSRGQLTDKVYLDGNGQHFTYYPDGRLWTASNQDISYTYAWYDNGWLKSVVDGSGRKITYDQYDGLGRRKQVTVMTGSADQRVISYDYDSANRLWHIYSNAGTFSFDYSDPLGRRKTLTYPNSTAAGYGYDDLSRISSLNHAIVNGAVFSGFSYPLYDSVGNLIAKNDNNGGQWTYSYDDIYRLSQSASDTRIENFTYDGRGNRWTGPGAKDPNMPDGDINLNGVLGFNDAAFASVIALQGTPVTPEQLLHGDVFPDGRITLDDANILWEKVVGSMFVEDKAFKNYLFNSTDQLAVGRRLGYHYDDYGNQTDRTVATDKALIQTWDYENRLVKVEKTKGSEKRTITFKYDPFGKRIEKKVVKAIDGVTTTSTYNYLYDLENVAMETLTASTGTTKTFYTHGPDTDQPLALQRNGQFYYYHADRLGSIVAITDGSHNIVQSYDYDSFGMPKPSTNFANSYMYTGREWDPETGLYYYNARYYDPMEGRFISKDPISFAGGDVNLYGYVRNNPVNRIDPLGLWYIDLNVTGGSGKGGTAGVQIGPSGVYVYGGVGYGSGGGVSVTLNAGDPSTGFSVNATASGGTGTVGGLTSVSYDSTGISKMGDTYGTVGAGWGVGLGVAVTGTYTYPIWQPQSNKCN